MDLATQVSNMETNYIKTAKLFNDLSFDYDTLEEKYIEAKKRLAVLRKDYYRVEDLIINIRAILNSARPHREGEVRKLLGMTTKCADATELLINDIALIVENNFKVGFK
jgi:hypothetical protein